MAEDSGCISGKNYFLRDLRFELLNNLFLFPYNINPVITTEMEIITNGRSPSLAAPSGRASNFSEVLMGLLFAARYVREVLPLPSSIQLQGLYLAHQR